MIYLEFTHDGEYVETVICRCGLPVPHRGDTVSFHHVDYTIQDVHFSYRRKEDRTEPHRSVSVVYRLTKS